MPYIEEWPGPRRHILPKPEPVSSLPQLELRALSLDENWVPQYETPKSSFELQLNKSSYHIYVLGEPVSGTAFSKIPIDTEAFRVCVAFHGHSNVEFIQEFWSCTDSAKTRDFKDAFRYFGFHQVLLKGPTALQKRKVHEWRFDFKFPTWTTSDFSDTSTAYQERLFRGYSDVLPSCIRSEGGKNNGGCIVYEVEAKLMHGGESPVSQIEYLNFVSHQKDNKGEESSTENYSKESATVIRQRYLDFGLWKLLGNREIPNTVQILTPTCAVTEELVSVKFKVDMDLKHLKHKKSYLIFHLLSVDVVLDQYTLFQRHAPLHPRLISNAPMPAFFKDFTQAMPLY